MGALLETCSYRDAKGRIGKIRFYVFDGGTPITQAAAAGAVLAAVDTISNGHRQTWRGPDTGIANTPGYGSVAQFQNAEDKAVFTFYGASGAYHRLMVPSPASSIFEPDLETVDQANANVVTLITAVLANATDSAGTAISGFVGAVRGRRKMQRRLNLLILTPDLTTNEPAE